MGIDDAGRGAVIGPLVIAGASFFKKDLKKLKELGVKDSKELSKEKREELAEKIEELASEIIVMKVKPCKIDSWRKLNRSLDLLEAKKMAEIIQISNANIFYLDALTSRPQKFKRVVESFLDKKVKIKAENFADKKYVVVSAASIIAKVERDKEIEELKKKVKFDFGVGYPHDPKTIEFLKKLIEEKKELPTFIRKTWLTTEILLEEKIQKKISQFLVKR